MNFIKGAEASEVLEKIFEKMEKKHVEYISSLINDFCTSTNQLYKNDIFQKEVLAHYLLDYSTEKAEKYMKKDVSFFRNVLSRHLKILKEYHK